MGDGLEDYEVRWVLIIFVCLMIGLIDVVGFQLTALLVCLALYKILKPVDR